MMKRLASLKSVGLGVLALTMATTAVTAAPLPVLTSAKQSIEAPVQTVASRRYKRGQAAAGAAIAAGIIGLAAGAALAAQSNQGDYGYGYEPVYEQRTYSYGSSPTYVYDDGNYGNSYYYSRPAPRSYYGDSYYGRGHYGYDDRAQWRARKEYLKAQARAEKERLKAQARAQRYYGGGSGGYYGSGYGGGRGAVYAPQAPGGVLPSACGRGVSGYADGYGNYHRC